VIYQKIRYFFHDTIYRYQKRYIDIFDILNHHYSALATLHCSDWG